MFSQFEEALRIGPAQLSDRLGELQQLGILQARAYGGTRQEYRLTKAGIALYPLTLEMVRWGNRWLWRRPPTDHPAPALRPRFGRSLALRCL
ncbi:MAG: transcriptional regulator [Betaproteobacteria bacterium]|nr:transcriptional regulator [Betaproteobacteria bacterium]